MSKNKIGQINYILPLIIGFLAAFIGLTTPLMLNMTAARISIEKEKKAGKDKKESNYITGLGMSSLNMLAILFYLAMATLAESKGWMTIEKPYSTIYVIGAVLGAFSLFALYTSFAEIIAKKAQFIAKNINYFT